MSVNVGNAVAYIDLDASKFTSGLSKIGKDFSQFMDNTESAGTRITALGNGLKNVGSSITKNVTVPFVALGTTLSKFAIDTEQSMAKVNSILKLSKEDFAEYETTLKKGANEIGLAYDTYAESAYNAISAGVAQADVTNFLTDANKLAKGGLTDLAKATDVLTTIQNAYGLSQKDMAKVSDVLIQTQNKGKTTVDELASSMGKIIPTANSLGVNVEQLGAGYAILTAKGIATAEATTYMNSMFNELGKSGTKVDKALREISGKSFKELSESGKTTGDILKMLDDYAKKSGLSLTDLFGSAEAGKSALTLLSDGVEGFNGMLDEMKNSTGATNDAFNEMNGTMKESLVQSMERLKNAMSDLGTAFAPVVSFIAELITSLANWIIKMQETHPQILNIILVVAGLVAGLGPLLMLIGSVITILPIVGAGFVALGGPIGLVIAGITLLISTIVYLCKNWDQMKADAERVWNSLVASFKTWMDNMKTSIETTWNNIKTFFTNTWNSIKDKASEIWNSLVTSMNQWVNNMKTSIETAWNSIKTFTTTIWNNIKSAIDTVWQGIKNIVSTGVDLVKTTITNVWDTIYDILISPFKRASEFIGGILGSISSAVSGVIDKVSGIFGKSIDIEANVNQLRMAMAYDVANSSRVAETASITDSIGNFAKNIGTVKDIGNANGSMKNVVINNTYNSPKAMSIRELKKQDEIQMRRLAMQL